MFKLRRSRGRSPSKADAESFSREMQDFSARIDLVTRLAAKIESVRDHELEILRGRVSMLTEQLAEMKAAKERAEALLEREIRRKAAANGSLNVKKPTETGVDGKIDPFEILIS